MQRMLMCVYLLDSSPSFADDHPRRVYIWPGTVHNITCRVNADPVPQIQWLRAGLRLLNNRTYHIFSTDTVSRLQVRYGCVVECRICNGEAAGSNFGFSPTKLRLVRYRRGRLTALVR